MRPPPSASMRLLIPLAVPRPTDNFCTSGFSQADLARHPVEPTPKILFSSGKESEGPDVFIFFYLSDNFRELQTTRRFFSEACRQEVARPPPSASMRLLIPPDVPRPTDNFCTSGFSQAGLARHRVETIPESLSSSGKEREGPDVFMFFICRAISVSGRLRADSL